jgi:hypothetical protein
MRRIISATIFAAASLAACGDSGPSGVDANARYTATVTGALAADISGPAYFGSDVSDGEAFFAVVLGSSTSTHTVVLAVNGTRPATGTYDIVGLLDESGADGWTALHMVGQGNQTLGSFMGVSGRVTITESTAQRLKGTFEYAADGFIAAPGGIEDAEISVKGEFTAAPATAAALAPAFQRVVR